MDLTLESLPFCGSDAVRFLRKGVTMSKTLPWSRKSILRLLIASLVVFGATLLNRGASAQDAEQAAKITEKLPQESKDVIGRLTALRELPDGQWKMHAG